MASDVLNYEEIGRVLEAVKNNGGDIPEKFYPPECGEGEYFKPAREAREKLARDISVALTWWRMHPSLNSNPNAKRHLKNVDDIKNKSKIIRDIIFKNETELYMLNFSSEDGFGLHSLLEGLEILEEKCEQHLKELKESGRENKALLNAMFPDEKSKNRVPQLMERLKDIFEAHFSQKAIIKQDSTNHNAAIASPFTVFVQQIKGELRLEELPTATPASIKKALRRSKEKRDNS